MNWLIEHIPFWAWFIGGVVIIGLRGACWASVAPESPSSSSPRCCCGAMDGRTAANLRSPRTEPMPIKPFAKPMPRASMLLFVTLILTGCGHLTASGETEAPPPARGADTFCAIAKPITWSSRDTDLTITGVKSHNAVGIRLCGWQGAD